MPLPRRRCGAADLAVKDAADASERTTSMAEKRATTKPPMTRSQLAVILIVAIVVMTVIDIVLYMSIPTSAKTGERAALFGIRKIVVEGNTHYNEQDIVDQSGLRVGQSVFLLNKTEAAERVRNAFAYAESVEVDTKLGLDTARITIKEASPLGVIPTQQGWLLISTQGRGLRMVDEKSEVISRYMRITGGTGGKTAIGSRTLDDRSLWIVTTLLQVLGKQGYDQLTEINMTDKTDIRVRWNNQITFLVGSDDNLEHKASVIAATMTKVLGDYGTSARGTLNVRAYSDAEDQKKYIVFRPEGLDEALTRITTTTAPEGSDSTAATDANGENAPDEPEE